MVVDPGHSARKANDYRLTYPDDDMGVVIGDLDDDTGVVIATGINDDVGVVIDHQGRHGCRVDDDTGVVPTTPRTSPQEKFYGTTPVVNDDAGVVIGSQVHFPVNATSPLDDDVYVVIADDDTGVVLSDEDEVSLLAFLAEDDDDEIITHAPPLPRFIVPSDEPPW